MYLSRIELNPQNRDTMRALHWPNVLHGAIERSFQDKEERKLWRIDYFCQRCYLLILSKSQPDFTALAEQFCVPGTKGMTISYQPLLDSIEAGQQYRFRLCANPVRSTKYRLGAGKDDRGQVKAHVTQDQQCSWLIDKAARCGFKVDAGDSTQHTDKDGKINTIWTHPGFDVVHTAWVSFKHGNQIKPVTMRIAAFEGILTVTDANLFREKLIQGIGREKAYGCGLLTVIHMN